MQNPLLYRPHKLLFIGLSYLIWASVSLRWVTIAHRPLQPGKEWVYIPLGIFGLLIGLEHWLTRSVPWRVHLYLAFQTGLIFISSLFFSEVDFLALLYVPVTGQATYLLSRRPAYTWLALLLVVNFIGQIFQFGWPDALSFILLYTAGLIFTSAFSIFTLQAEASRRQTESLLTELQTAHQQLQEYAVQAGDLAIVRERNRLARDLHDSVTQTLYGLSLQSEAAARQLEAGQTTYAINQIREVRDIAQQALREMRLMIFELRPAILDQEGLIPALQTRLDAVEGRSEIRTTLRADGISRLPLEVENGLYGIAREALNNILKHAYAHQVEIELTRAGHAIHFMIHDDGVGFDPEGTRSGMGLNGMKERAAQLGGTFILASEPERGTRLHVEIPL
jgi:signal transduction histidine kinase